jgi:site-specific recombinase XerD
MKLSDFAHEYIAFKRALGMRFDTEAEMLASFCRHVGDVALVEVTVGQVRSYLDGRLPVSSYWERKHTALDGLFRFALQRDYVKFSPVPYRHPQLPPPLIPYIYSQEELKRLLDATPAACGPQVPMEAFVFRVLILLLYAACLRLGEALRLTINDVDLGQKILCVRETKFYKTRMVPIGGDLSLALNRYVRQRNRVHAHDPESPFFCFRDDRPLSQSAVRNRFRRLRVLAHVVRDDGAHYQPRIHDLRHSGTVHRLVAWYRNGSDLQRFLPQLATYLGHINLAATQRYLTMTPELLREASLRFERYAKEPRHE